ncbi:carboxypeptidase regulatory-like domain-containing protein [Streptomyces aureoverticillatus]|nr:carboxypeptidase regulatory-like domain-containing protein [Streptomyces aureoverticillatus]
MCGAVNPYEAAHAYEYESRDASGDPAKALPAYDAHDPATPYGPRRPGQSADSGAGLPEDPGPHASVVHGFIVTPDGDPIHSVTLTLLSKGGRQLDRVSSLADGSYILAAPAPGVYLLAATAPGYASRARHIMLGDGPLTYDLELVEAVGGGVSAVT